MYLSLFLMLCACSPSSLDDFRHEGESICREFAHELKGIETHEHLLKEAPKIKAYFDRLVTVMIQARKFQKEAEESQPLINEDSLASKALLGELKRIYQLEAGREIIEKAQKEALIKLDVATK